MFSIAHAADAVAKEAQSPIASLFPLVVIFAVFYFLIIRPQSKKQKELKNMVDETKQGDEIITSGGIFGKVVEIGDDYAVIDVSNGNNIKILKQTIAQNASFESRRKQEVEKMVENKKKKK